MLLIHLDLAVGVGVPWCFASLLIYVPQILKETEQVLRIGDRNVCFSEVDCSVLASLGPLSIFIAVLAATHTPLCLCLLPFPVFPCVSNAFFLSLVFLFTHTLSLQAYLLKSDTFRLEIFLFMSFQI